MKLGPIEVPEPETFTPGFGSVQFTGLLGEPGEVTEAQLIFLARQVAALEGQTIPIVTDAEIVPDAFYTVASVDVARIDGVALGAGWVEYELTAVPVPGHENPLIETHVSGALRSNGHGIAAGSTFPFHAVPVTAEIHGWGDPADAVRERAVDGGAVSLRSEDSKFTGVSTWSVEPADFYMGACEITAEVDGEWIAHTNRDALIGSWRLSNGLVRFFAPFGAQDLCFQWYDGTAWSTPISVSVYLDNILGGDVIIRRAAITDASTGQASVSLYGFITAKETVAYVITAAIRRGSPLVSLSFTPASGSSGLAATIVEIITGNTVTVPANPRAVWPVTVDGWSPVFYSPTTITASVPPGFDPGASAYPVTFGVGAVNASLVFSGMDTAANLQEEFFAVQSERDHIGVRL
jgi:hypothetical protein